MERRWWMILLNDLYGELLTDKQRHFFRLHYEEDLSFGEIALQHGVSRPAVHSAVKRAESLLLDYEKKVCFGLRLIRERETLGTLDSVLRELEGQVDDTERVQRVRKARDLVSKLTTA